MAVQLSQSTDHHKARGTWAIEERSGHALCNNTQEANLRLQSPSATTTTPCTSDLYLPLPFPECDGDNHGTNVTETIPPPPLDRWQCVRLPSQSDSETGVNLHSSLLNPRRAGVHWDVLDSNGRVAEWLKERWHPVKDLASRPALPSMSVVHPWLPWPITVHASGMDSRGVTVADVLLAVSSNLMIPIDETGRTRMWYLRGRQMFVGLRTSEIGGDVWELVVA
ncbi:hypothetical protein E1B28_005377 [Marasmius oreades]|uniref:DUF6699 domain-containing protein n=1 Tax=Marasmius oreades TaxID=181124 RepID=A0A9P7UW42_9AGAR|nr:uncharacterized protein E1B28_005377 [Marasmius oreades]KAG7094549.1 hypothetical protein E1B28_005377 [Marasmius oreades]